MLIRMICVAVSVAVPCFAQPHHHPEREPVLRFLKTQLDAEFRSEGVAIADLNHDGKMDIVAGYVWYEAPDWKMHTVLEKAPKYDPKGYSNSFCTFAQDLNHDGWADIIVVDFPGTPTWWFENPQNSKGPWKKHELTPVTNNESPQFADLDGDGKLEFLLGLAPDTKSADGPERRIAFAKPGKSPTDPWATHNVSKPGLPGARKYSHGLGAGDINGDGRVDIVVAKGWYEAPQRPSESPWDFHAAPFGDKAAHMYVYDFDDDGDNDVLSSSPHAYGIWWHEQTAPNQWKTHLIDKSFSQTHAVCFADINGDGLPDFVTGKRWWAHGGRDPGGNDPAVFFWFEMTREKGKPRWIRHQFDHNSGPGTQFQVADVNGDELLDVVTSNKKGVHLFTQVRD